MVEILPIRVLRDEDAPIFGKLNVLLGKLASDDLPVASGIVITPPNLQLKTTLEHYDFSSYEIIEQSLVLVKKDLEKIPIPEILVKELGKNDQFLVNGTLVKGANKLWSILLENWVNTLKSLIWKDGFAPGITEQLEAELVVFVDSPKAFGKTSLDPDGEVALQILHGKLEPVDAKQLDELVQKANKKLLIPHEFSWILEGSIKLSGISPYTPNDVAPQAVEIVDQSVAVSQDNSKSAVKMLLDLSVGEIPQTSFDGSFLVGEKIYDLNKPQESFDKLVLKMVGCADLGKSVLLKLADKSEGMGKIRGTLRLIHQQSLLEAFTEAIKFTRDNKRLFNIHLVVPFVRGISEFLAIRKELSVRKINRGNLNQLWLEVAVPENIINLEEYVSAGLDGLVINLDELMSHLSGFDINEQELLFYKKDIKALLIFLEDGLKTAHKMKIPFIATGSMVMYPEILEFLVEKGVYGIVVERYEADSGRDLIQRMEKKLVTKSLS